MRQTRGRSGAAWLVLVLLGLVPLLLSAPYGAVAQTGHSHNFVVTPAYSAPNPQVGVQGQTLYTGQVVSITFGSYMADLDECTGDTSTSVCSFSGGYGYSAIASNNLLVVSWSAGGSGGKFGYLDGSGAFIERAPGQPWSTVTHFKAPGVAGSVTVTVTVADDPHATDPATLMVIDTAYDGQKSRGTDITVTADPSKPTWEPGSAISGAAMSSPAVGLQATTGDSVSCAAASATDTDKKLPPSMGSMMAQTEYPEDTVAYRWTATGGSFAAPNSLSTTWTSNSPGSFTLTLTVDDQNDANKPSGDNGTRDDPAVVLTRTVQVNAPAPTWNAFTPINSGITSPAGDVTIGLGGSIALAAAVAADTDERVSESGTSQQADVCTYQWSASGAQGSFTSTSQQTTTWTAPSTAGSYTITLRVDDQNDANKPNGENGSRDDTLQTYTRTVHVYNASWAVSSAIGGAAISAPSAGVTTTRGGMVACSAASGAADNDIRTPLGGSAETVADAIRYTWSANGGSFQGGVVNQETATWIAPNQGGSFTLTLRVDDQDNANKPSDEGGTRDDPFVERTVMVTVKAPQWVVHTPIDSGGITLPATSMITVDPNQVVLCGTPAASDQDRRTDENNNVVTHDDVCTYLWSATGGAFQSTNNRDTAWTAPSDPGQYTLNLAVNDVAEKNPEGEGTRDDPTRNFTVTVKVRHFHQWSAPTAITPQEFTVGEGFPLPGEAVQLTRQAAGTDDDTCTATDCPFPAGRAANATHATQWSATAGTFGYYNNGIWFQTTDAALATHWKAPAITGNATLTLATDDTPSAIDPETNAAVTTADDAPATFAHTLKVVSHRHSWTAGDPLVAPNPAVDQPFPLANELVRVTAAPGTDSDHCTESGCPFPGGTAPNAVHILHWSCSAGQLGFLDNGVFTPASNTGYAFLGSSEVTQIVSSDPRFAGAQEVWWKAPDQVPYGGLDASITVYQEDLPEAYDPEREANVYTWWEGYRSTSVDLKVVRHRHQWETLDNLSVGEIQVETDTPTAGQVIQLDGGMGGYPGGSGYPGSDSDQCLAASCSFSPPYAWNDTDTLEWEATAGGSSAGAFGWLSGGLFVEKQPADPWSQVTHWRAPASVPVGGLPVTLRKTIDDVPEALDPELQVVVPTYDDAQAVGSRNITVVRHQHAWGLFNEGLMPPSFSVSSTTPYASGVVALTTTIPSPDTDYCNDFQGTCPFPGQQATNEVVVSEWSDAGAGGTFGKLVNNVFTALDATEPWSAVTHYRCPNVGGMLMLKLVIDDVWQGIPEPPTGEPINTYDDLQAEAQQWIEVQPPHVHEWSSTGNTANLPIYLREGDTPVTSACTGDVLPIVKGTWAYDHDLCANTDGRCPFPGGDATEDPAPPHKIVRYENNAGGMFGKLTPDGEDFIQSGNPEEITHFLVPQNVPAGGSLQIWAVIDDAAKVTEPGQVSPTPTIDDPEKPGDPHNLTVNACPVTARTRRYVSEEDACGCVSCAGGMKVTAPAYSDIDPLSGALSFEVPITQWSYRGMELGLTLAYNSGSTADPTMESPDWPGVNAQPDLARLSRRNSRWTHNWAQFLEVVESGGELHALWHTGGGSVGFLGNSEGAWIPNDNGQTLVSGGTSTRAFNYKREVVMSASSGEHPEGAQACGPVTGTQRLRIATVMTPYSWFEVTDTAGTVYRFEQVYWESGVANGGIAVPYFPLSTITDRFGRTITLTWNQGQLLTVKDGADIGLTFSYSGGLLTSVQDPHGRQHLLGYSNVPDQAGNTWPKLASATVKGPGTPSVQHQWGFEYGPGSLGAQYGGTYTGDLVVRKTEPSGKVVNYTYAPVGLSRTAYSDWDGTLVNATYYDAAEGRNKTISRSGGSIVYPGGRGVTYTYSGHDLASVRDDATGREVSYTYDAMHRLLTVKSNADPVPQVTYAYTVAADNRTVTQVTATDLLGHVSVTDLGAFQLPTQSTVIRGAAGPNLVTKVTYDALGRPLAVTAPFGLPLATTSYLGYGSADVPDAPTSVTDSLGRVMTSTLDGAGRVTSSTSPENLVAPPGHPDRAPSVSVTQYSADGLPVLLRDPLGREAQVSYAGLTGGKLQVTTTRVADGASSVAVMDAAGNVVSVIDEAGVESAFLYNGDGALLVAVEALGPNARTTRYEYNLSGDLTALLPPKGELGRVSFDYRRYSQAGVLEGTDEGQVTRILHPDGTEEYCGYNTAGELAWESRPYLAGGTPQWSVITYEYDELHRPLRVNYPTSPGGVLGFTVETEYDDLGRVKRVTDSTGSTLYTYDDLGRVTALSPSGGRKQVTLTYTPDLTLKRWITSTTLAGVGTWEEREDTKGRFSGTVNPFGQSFSLEYNLAGQPVKRHQPNNTRTDYAYNGLGQLASMAHYLANGTLLDQLSYTYDGSGRLLTETDSGSRVHAYAYDVLGQLIDEQHPDLGAGGVQYQYDANGNRTQVVRGAQTEWYGVDNADKLLWTNTTATGGTNPGAPTAGQGTGYSLFGYDALGQTTTRDRRGKDGQRHTFNFNWDADGRLREVWENGAPALTAQYAADGERVNKTDGAGAHVNSFRLHDSAGAGTTYTPGFAERKNGQDRFSSQDHLGSTRYLTDSTGNTTPAALRYDAYGLRSASAGTDPAHPTDHQYAGAWGYQREETAGLGLDYLHHRYYDAEVGRFITRDPIRWTGGLNLYGYVENQPVQAVDPLGLTSGYVPPEGHHYVPQAIWRNLPLPAHVKAVFYNATTGKIPYGHNYTEHGGYSRAVKGMWDDYLKRYDIKPESMTCDQAEQFVNSVRKSRNPIVRSYLDKYVTQRFAARAIIQRTLARVKGINLKGSVGTGLNSLGLVISLWDFTPWGQEASQKEDREYWAVPGNFENYWRDPAKWHRMNPFSMGPSI